MNLIERESYFISPFICIVKSYSPCVLISSYIHCSSIARTKFEKKKQRKTKLNWKALSNQMFVHVHCSLFTFRCCKVLFLSLLNRNKTHYPCNGFETFLIILLCVFFVCFVFRFSFKTFCRLHEPLRFHLYAKFMSYKNM